MRACDQQDSSVFVRDVFQAITYKSYLPDAPPVPKHAPPPPAFAALPVAFPAIQPPGLSYDDAPGHLPQFPSYVGQSRKRSFDGGDELDGRDGQYGGRSWKQPRRGAGFGFGGRGGRPEAGNGHLNSSYPPFPENGQLPQGFLTGMSETLAALQQQMGLPPAPGYPASAQGQRRRARCRDYETKGYCSRGNTCLFEHGDDSIYVPPPSTGFGAPFAAPANPIEEYDPTNPGIFTLPPNLPPHQSLQHDGGYSSRGRGGRQQGPKRRPKAPFSADGPVFDRAKSTIVVENIPEENFDEEQVRGFFSQFGNILEVSMQPYKRLAIVKFDTWTSANAAYRSPKVVFDNRFVKIFWYKEEDTSLPPSKPLGGGSEQHGEGGGDGQSAAMPEIDMEEFLRKQEEAQKIYEEKRKKAEELERQREELAKREQELLARHREERAKLAEKMKAKLGGGSQQGDGSEDGSKSKSTSEALRAQLAALEAEALQLGIDPDAMEDTSYSTSSWNARGGYYGGRGAFRGAYRARGFAARGYRGAPFRGGARGNHHAAYAMYSLDNRPKKVTLTGMDFTVPEKDETLRQYLFVSFHYMFHFSYLTACASNQQPRYRALASSPTSKPPPQQPTLLSQTARRPRSSLTASCSTARKSPESTVKSNWHGTQAAVPDPLLWLVPQAAPARVPARPLRNPGQLSPQQPCHSFPAADLRQVSVVVLVTLPWPVQEASVVAIRTLTLCWRGAAGTTTAMGFIITTTNIMRAISRGTWTTMWLMRISGR